MTFDQIEAFYWVATLKNMTLAAKQELYRTQSAVSARIQKLEYELGAQLLDTSDKKIRLTPAGRRFLGDAERLCSLWREIKTRYGVDAERTVSLRIGAIESVLHSWLIPWIEQLRVEQPAIELELTVETTPTLLDLVRERGLDLALAAEPLHEDRVNTRALPALPMVFVGNRALHKRRKYTLEQLAEYQLLTFQRGSQPHVALRDILRRAGLKTPRVHAISSISAMRRMVAGGFGVATLPQPAIERFAAEEGLLPLRCETPLVPLPIYASWHEDPISGVTDAVVESAVAFAQSRRSGATPRHRKHR